MANSHTAVEILSRYGYTQNNKTSKVVRIEWVADPTAADPENFSGITLPGGFIVNIITKPGSPAPTSYGVELLSPWDTTLDILGGSVSGRAVDTTEVVQPVRTGEVTPVFVSQGSYTLSITGNTTNSAQGTVWIEMVEAN